MLPLIRNQSDMTAPARLAGAAQAVGWLVVGLVAARALWLAVTPAGPLGSPPLAANLAANAAASAMALAASDPFFPQGSAAADTVSGLDLALVGTRVDAASARGSAIIAAADGRQQSYGVGDEIMPGVRLAAVAYESVTLDRGGARETLYIDQSPGAVAAPPIGMAQIGQMPITGAAPTAPTSAQPGSPIK
ncbi:type II secretion system protein N [Sandarakinorhabdus sp.]|uniref:type II secretion system protein N n=1 Tax=Sandarakinorhabdus sp. TaxID=1916663 RepID=UPI003342566D